MTIHCLRRKKVRALFTLLHIDAFLISKPENIFYLSGFRGDDSVLFVTLHDIYIITDARYENELHDNNHGCKIVIKRKNTSLADTIRHLMKRKRTYVVGFEPTHISYYQYRKLKKDLRTRKLKPCYRMIENLRMIKDASETRAIKEAITIAERSLQVLTRGYFSTKYREKDLANLLEYTMEKAGAERASFPIIVATGRRSAFPHAVSGKTVLKRNAPLLIDFGARRGGYCSDLTRTFFLGTITARFKRLYRLIIEARERAFDTIKAGVSISSVVKNVRDIFKEAKVDQYFTHALGHGIGLEVHESPSLLYTCTDRFEENMVVTVEPGLYINTWGGIRIEDMVRVTAKGCERLSSFPTIPI